MFFKKVSGTLSPKIRPLFRFLFRQSIFPDEKKICNTVPIPKSSLTADCNNYRPISILPVLSKVAEKLIFKPLYKHLESNGLLANRQYAYRKQLGTCDALLDLTCHMQDDLDKGYESRIVQIDFSSAFDLVNTLTFLRPPKLSAYYRLDVKTSTEKRVSKYSRNNIYSVRCRCC